jgi:hypothetical protein
MEIGGIETVFGKMNALKTDKETQLIITFVSG